jgi:hypothetical protein
MKHLTLLLSVLALSFNLSAQVVISNATMSGVVSPNAITTNYAGPVSLANTNNAFSGTFTGNGAGLTNYYGTDNVKWWGAKGDGITDDTAAIQSCIDYNSTSGRGSVRIPAGTYLITSLNLTARTIDLIGIDGRNTSIFCGGTNGYPMLDFSGSTWCNLKDIVVRSTTPTITPSCGILIGRTNVDSAGEHTFNRVFVHGHYSVAGVYSIASEVNAFRDCWFAQGGNNTPAHASFYSAKNATNIFSVPVQSLFQTLVDDGNGGNSLNEFANCMFTSHDSLPASTPLVLEFALGHSFDCCYWSTRGPTNQIQFGKSAVGIAFTSCRQEAYDWLPHGIYIANGEFVYKDVSFRSSHFYSVAAEDTTTLANWSFASSYWNGTNGVGARVVDAAVMVDCKWSEGVNAPDMGWFVADGKYRARTGGLNNRFEGIPITRLEGEASDDVSVSGKLTVDTAALVVSNSKVGFGTTTPSNAPVDISYAVNGSTNLLYIGNPAIASENQSGSVVMGGYFGNLAGIKFSAVDGSANSDSGTLTLQTATHGSLHDMLTITDPGTVTAQTFNASATNAINHFAGSVGIGSAFPNAKLDVACAFNGSTNILALDNFAIASASQSGNVAMRGFFGDLAGVKFSAIDAGVNSDSGVLTLQTATHGALHDSITITDPGNITASGTVTATASIITNSVAVPTVTATTGALWNSNSVLYWVTSTKTNVVSDGR